MGAILMGRGRRSWPYPALMTCAYFRGSVSSMSIFATMSIARHVATHLSRSPPTAIPRDRQTEENWLSKLM